MNEILRSNNNVNPFLTFTCYQPKINNNTNINNTISSSLSLLNNFQTNIYNYNNNNNNNNNFFQLIYSIYLNSFYNNNNNIIGRVLLFIFQIISFLGSTSTTSTGGNGGDDSIILEKLKRSEGISPELNTFIGYYRSIMGTISFLSVLFCIIYIIHTSFFAQFILICLNKIKKQISNNKNKKNKNNNNNNNNNNNEDGDKMTFKKLFSIIFNKIIDSQKTNKRSNLFKSISIRLFFFFQFCELLGASSDFWTVITAHSASDLDPFCQIQAVHMNYFDYAKTFWALVVAVYLILSVTIFYKRIPSKGSSSSSRKKKSNKKKNNNKNKNKKNKKEKKDKKDNKENKENENQSINNNQENEKDSNNFIDLKNISCSKSPNTPMTPITPTPKTPTSNNDKNENQENQKKIIEKRQLIVSTFSLKMHDEDGDDFEDNNNNNHNLNNFEEVFEFDEDENDDYEDDENNHYDDHDNDKENLKKGFIEKLFSIFGKIKQFLGSDLFREKYLKISFEILCHVFSWGMSLIFVLLVLVPINNYGKAGSWCWISSTRCDPWGWFWRGCCYVVIWITVFIILIIYILLIIYVAWFWFFVIQKKSWSKKQKKKILQKFFTPIVKMIFYPIMMIISRIPPSANRLYEVLNNNQSLPLFLILHSLVKPTQGLLNSLVFFLIPPPKWLTSIFCCCCFYFKNRSHINKNVKDLLNINNDNDNDNDYNNNNNDNNNRKKSGNDNDSIDEDDDSESDHEIVIEMENINRKK